jgi:hypothetical protein
MAITIIEQPQSHTPIYNDMVFVMEGTLFPPPKYIIGLDVYIVREGIGDTYLGRIKSPQVVSYQSPRAGIYTYFNLKELIKQSIFFGTKSTFAGGDISHLIKIIPGEEYAASASGVATYYPSSGNVQYVGFNGALRLDEFRQFVPTDLINTTAIAAADGEGQYILSSYTQAKDILKSTLNELTFLCNGGTNTRAVISYFQDNTYISQQWLYPTTANRTDITINASYNSLAIPTNANKMTVRLNRVSNGNWLSPAYNYNILDACSKYPTLNVYFQNKWGAYDSFIFNKKSTKQDTINRKTYQKQDRYINTYNSYDPAIRIYDSEIKTKHTLSTDWITEDEMNFLSELVESNNVQFSYDETLTGGSFASIEMRVYRNSVTNDYGFQPNEQRLSAVMGGITLNFYGTVTDTGYTASGFYEGEVLPMLQSSEFAPYFNFSVTYGFTDPTFGPYFLVKFTAKQKGAGYSLSSVNIYTSDQISFQNNIAGVNNVLPTPIPIYIEDTSFQFKTRDNDKLFQLTINATETSVYNRQNV